MNPAPGRFRATLDAPFPDGLPSYTCETVELAAGENAVRVGYPGHLPLSGSHVGCRNIALRADAVLPYELVGIAPSHSFHDLGSLCLGVDPDSTLGTTEGNIDDRALERHQGGQGNHLVPVHIG